MLAGGVALFATNVYLTTSLLPSAVAEIGGGRFYAWATTVFLLPSVVSAVLVSRLLASVTNRAAYLLATGLFAAGCVIAMLAPDMAVLLLGRAVQGAGGGLLAGLAYALLRVTLPEPLWGRGAALLSMMWAVGTVLGPVLGGLLAQLGLWRGGFASLGLLSVLVLACVPRVLGDRRTPSDPEPFPLLGLLLVGGAALVLSIAGVFAGSLLSWLGVLLGLVLLAGAIAVERRGPVRVLPVGTFLRGSRLRWLYGTLALLAIGSTTEQFVPLFGQRLSGLRSRPVSSARPSPSAGPLARSRARTRATSVCGADWSCPARSYWGSGSPPARSSRPAARCSVSRWRCWWPEPVSGSPGRT